MTNSNKRHDSSVAKVSEHEIYEAAKGLGWVIPVSEADVQRAEMDLSANQVQLPSSLADASEVFEQFGNTRIVRLNRELLDEDAGSNLARAAREGGEIPDEIEERMKQDREESKRVSDKE